MSPEEVVAATAKPILELGRAWIAAPPTAERAARLGLDAPFGFWVNGRAGVLGDVDADVAAAAIGFMDPGHVRRYWERRPSELSPARSTEEYLAAAGEWSLTALETLSDEALVDVADLARRVAAAAQPSVGVLFAGWRAVDPPDSPAAAATLALNVLREHRGGAHLSAVQAVGLGPVGAILAADDPVRGGAAGAERFGWSPPFPEADAARRSAAEEMTNTICVPAYAALDDDERTRFASVVVAAREALGP